MFLPVAVVAVVGMMVFPLPTLVLDFLLTANLAFALALLISAVYLTEAGSFTSLPAVLLLATLLRLGLNISTTRQILSQGTAPRVIETFGNFVVGGNLVVGAVIFIIITVVQFLVIAKGAERIAEVAARFTLDAMPGKQMSVDADVRAGMLSLEEARERRRELHRESRLFGALDGAMKFVKGDAIAGLLITLINISAGLVIGVTQLQLSLGQALERYTLFTIGDGLVSQVPALLVAVAAGVAVTRVEDREGSYVGREMLSQLAREPQALATTGTVLLVMAFLPGLPLLPFVAGGAALTLLAHRITGGRQQNDAARLQGQFKPRAFSSVVLRLGMQAAAVLQQEGVALSAVQRLRGKIFENRGVIVPDLQYDLTEQTAPGTIELWFKGVRLKTVSPDQSSAPPSAVRPAGGLRFQTQETLSSRLLAALEELFNEQLSELIDDTHTRILFEVHSSEAEDLINSTVPELISVTQLTRVLKQLTAENVSIRDLRSILQAVAEAAAKDGKSAPPFNELLAEVRQALSRSISSSICGEGWELEAWMLDQAADRHLTDAAVSGSADPELVDELVASLEKNRVGVLITGREARLICSELCRVHCPGLCVVAVNELSAEVRLKLRGTIGREEEKEERSETYQAQAA